MNCEEFRKQIVAADAEMQVLEQHLESCPECSAWVARELATPPQGLSQAEWDNATSRCMPASLPTTQSETAVEKDPEPIATGFFSGLKYGMVFGLSIVTGLAIIQLAQFTPPETKPASPPEMVSFIDDQPQELQNFLENNFEDVTFFDYRDSKMMSFVENEKIPSFIEENQMEEETWIEKDSG